MSSRSYSWLATNGGAWSLPSNWDDLTDGINPSLLVPGPQDSVSVTGATGDLTTALMGPGSALVAAFFNNVALDGAFSFGALSLGSDGSGGLLAIGPGSSVSAGAATVGSGSVVTSGAAAALSISGTLALGGAGSANLDATSGGRIQAGAVTLQSGSAIYVDASSAIEVGNAGGALPGALTIDAGATLSGAANADAYGPVINNGTISAAGGDLLIGSVSGTGLLSITASSELTLNGSTGAGQSVVFATASGTLALATEFDGPQGTVTGFAPGDAIDVLGSAISSAGYFPLGHDVGLLSLYYGNQVAVTMTLLGNYTNDIFLTANDGAGGTLITVSPDSNGGGTISGGTASPDQYLWTLSTGGVWNNAQNWEDLTTGANPARIAPGKNNLVSINCAQQGSFSVISGPADAASLAVTGDLAMTGSFTIGSVVLGTADNYGTIGNLDLLPEARITAQSLAIVDGELSLTGQAVFSVLGTVALGGGAPGAGLPMTELALSAGATLVAAGGLSLGGGSGDTITTDPTAVLEIGSAGNAAAGAVTIDAGATLSGNGSVNPFGAIIDNGTISAAGGVLSLGSVTGTGALTIGAGAGLLLEASSAVPVFFTGADGVLAVANELVSASGTITGFVNGDAIDIEGDPITSVTVGKITGGVNLTLYYNSTVVDHFTLAGTYTGDRFFLVPDGGFGTDILVDNANGGGGGGGQGNTDLLSWAQPVSGYWNKTANWFDITTNAAASAPPGTLNAVQIAGPTGFGFQTIGGPAVSASMAFFGNTYVSGAWSTGSLTVGGLPSGSTTLTTGTLEVGAATGMTANAAQVNDGLILVAGNSATLTVMGTLSLGDGSGNPAELSASGGGDVYLDALTMAGGAATILLTDALSSIEIGTLNDAQTGAVVLDAGNTLAGNGSINPLGTLIVNGTLTAQGGTLEVGNVSGAGVLTIGAAATLELIGTELCPIEMLGAGASLMLAGASESVAAPISGFLQGDQIVIATGIVGSVAYTPGPGNVGTLTLYNGGQVAGTLLLGGDFSGDTFTVQPDGQGSLIAVQAGQGGPSQGTGSPDNYQWIGGIAGGAWNTAANWEDVSAGQDPAAIAPGVNDLVTIQGGASAYASIGGPANAAFLTLLGEVALVGQYAVGELAVGQEGSTGVLGLGTGTLVQAGQATVTGGIVAQGGTLTSTGTLVLDGGALLDSGQALVQVAGLLLSGSGDAVSVDGISVLEIGTAGGAAAGVITIDAGAILAGTGVLDPLGSIADAGTITALAGAAALSIGNVSGAGSLLVGVGGDLQLDGTAGASLLIDFAGPGTLSIAGALPLAAIAGFGDGSEIAVPISGITSANYAQTAPNVGVLTLDVGTQAVGALTLVGVSQGQAFSVAGAGGGTIITTTINPSGGGGSSMRNMGPQSGSGQPGIISDFYFWQTLPVLVQQALALFQQDVGGTSYVYTSPDGSYFGPYQPGYANIAVVTDPIAYSSVALPPGYDALLAQGNTPVRISDGAGNHVLLLGNSANDTVVGNGPDDTLVGGVGGSSVIYAAETATVLGGGSDSIISTANGPCNITTSGIGRSVVFLGAATGNVVTLSGNDLLVAVGGNGANDTIHAVGTATIFAPSLGLMNFYGGAGADLVVGGGGTMEIVGGTGNGSTIWCGNSAEVNYIGGGGSAEIIGGNGALFVNGGAGPMTVFGGTSVNVIEGSAGPSEIVTGFGASTVTAASGNLVWLVGSANDSLVASGGNATIWGAGSTGNNVFQAGNGPVTMSGGYGNDTFLGGTGSALMLSGGGADVFSFTNGLAGGAATLDGFNINADQIDLQGYSGYTNALVGGNEVLSLSDGTSITLAGVGSMNGVVVHVY